jgi:peptide deformylase
LILWDAPVARQPARGYNLIINTSPRRTWRDALPVLRDLRGERKATTTISEKVLLLGDPGLRAVCDPVIDFETQEFQRSSLRLKRALETFRAEYGFGRAISAPQIGILQRMIAMNLGQGPFLLVNPEITRKSDERFTMWDDCMSFPWLMVRLRRHVQIDLTFRNETGDTEEWNKLEQAVSELVQHEVDHLNGVLAVDHALDRDSIIARQLYEERKELFDRQVDYFITPTL